MADSDAQSGYVWLVQFATTLAASITGAIGSYFVYRWRRARVDVTHKQVAAAHETSILQFGATERSEAFKSLLLTVQIRDTYIAKLEAERDGNDAAVDKMRAERNEEHQAKMEALSLLNESTRRIARLERQIREMGGEPVNGHG